MQPEKVPTLFNPGNSQLGWQAGTGEPYDQATLLVTSCGDGMPARASRLLTGLTAVKSLVPMGHAVG